MSMDILVTGAGRGIGFHTARALAEEGHRVFATARRLEGPLTTLAGKYKNVCPCLLDVESERSVSEAAKYIAASSGGLDAVLSVAGFLSANDRDADVFSLLPEDLNAMLSVNLVGAARVIRFFDPLMRDGGIFITITSEAASISNPFASMPGYQISKAAANKLVSIQAVSVSRYRVLALHPGRVDTDMNHVSAEITADQCAEGICALRDGTVKPPDGEWFVNYRGEAMPH
jgi:NAD(P)-dependent dehydrogenase (short-subunit alcohol dehydrogenase family)